MQLLHDPVIVLLGIYPSEMKTYDHTKTYTRIIQSHFNFNNQNFKMFNKWMVKKNCGKCIPWYTTEQ